MKYLITKELLDQARELVEKADKRQHIRGRDFLKVYNAITKKNESSTGCSSCWRKRVNLLRLIIQEEDKKTAAVTAKQEPKLEDETEAAEQEPKLEDKADAAEIKPKKKRGRPPKKKNNAK